MPKIKMIRTLPGSNDGITVTEFMEGREYDVSDDLADNFVRQQGAAIPAAPAAQTEPKVATEAETPKPGPGPTASKDAAPAEAKPAAKRPVAPRGGAR